MIFRYFLFEDFGPQTVYSDQRLNVHASWDVTLSRRQYEDMAHGKITACAAKIIISGSETSKMKHQAIVI